MSEFMKLLLSLSLSGTLLLLFMFLLKRLYRNRFSKRWQYYIWLLVAFRFIAPFSPDTTIVGSLFETAGTIITHVDTVNADALNAKEPDNADIMGIPLSDNSGNYTFNKSIDIYTSLFFIWSTFVLVFIMRKITVYQSFIRYMKANNREVSDVEILNLLSDCEEKLNIKKQVELYRNPLIASPIMTGFIHPGIIIPANQAAKQELSYIFMHELIHYKRRDMFYKWFIQLIVCVHWFNPFVHLLEKEINKACELSCDEAVIYSLDDKGREAYGDTLLSSMRTDRTYRNSFASLTLTEGAEQLKERLGAIMHFKKKTKYIAAVSIITAVLLFASSMIIGAYAAPPAKEDTPEIALSTNFKVMEEDGVYYIFCDGADESDKPIGGVTEGSIAFTLVRKDGYTSLSGFTDLETLVDDVKEQLELPEFTKYTTRDEKKMVIEVASQISDQPSYSVTDQPENEMEDVDVLTYSLTLEEAPDNVQNWVRECSAKASNIYVTEHDDRYWIYTNAIGENNSFMFNISSDNAGKGTITIIPNNEDGNGYALLSAPEKYDYLVVNCGNYSVEVNG